MKEYINDIAHGTSKGIIIIIMLFVTLKDLDWKGPGGNKIILLCDTRV